jgi:hypothetical protein
MRAGKARMRSLRPNSFEARAQPRLIGQSSPRDRCQASCGDKAIFQRAGKVILALFSGYRHGVNLLVPERCARAALDFWHEVEATGA